jgi:hypothetical protein
MSECPEHYRHLEGLGDSGPSFGFQSAGSIALSLAAPAPLCFARVCDDGDGAAVAGGKQKALSGRRLLVLLH